MSEEKMERDLRVKRFAVFVHGCFIGERSERGKWLARREVKEDWYNEKYGWDMDELMVQRVL